MLGVLTVSFQNCSLVKFGPSSDQENKVLTDEPFVFDANSRVNGVEAGGGNPSENLRVTSAYEASRFMVQDCSAPVVLDDGTSVDRAEYEKELALAAAAADTTGATVPVEFAISFGQVEDKLAMWAHRRAVLASSSDLSIIPVGDKASGEVLTKNKKKYLAYYQANHASAREHYIYGRNCFFDTVKIEGGIHLQEWASTYDTYDFIKAEEPSSISRNIRLMLYGSCASSHTDTCATSESVYGAGAYSSAGYPNRLFGEAPYKINGEHQIVKLYVADLRESAFGLGTSSKKIIKVPADKERGAEIQMSASESFDLLKIFRNRDLAIWNLSNDFSTKATSSTPSLLFRGMRGVPQLLANLINAGIGANTISSQYTPIVLDLGAPKVKTTSVFDGTFFDMAAKSTASESANQLTAWLGGSIEDMMPDANRNKNPDMKGDFRRVSDDGFLIIANASGSVDSSRDLLGDNTVVNGKTYANGFLALQALAQKDCAAVDTKSHYIGPWDGDLYSKTLKVWTDSNRNGVADQGEIKSLKDVGVVAINACNIVHADATDAFGNGTSLRSAFLFQDGEDITDNETEIVNRLEKGVRADGKDADFRLAIDLIFKVKEDVSLSN